MDTVVKRLYEGLFLVDSGLAASDWDGINEAINKILAKAGAEVVSLKKWDERKLAYDIERKSRGTYILVYFNCDTSRLAAIERDVQLSEQIMRVMILRTDKMSSKDIEKDTPAMVAEARAVETVAKAEAKAEGAEAVQQDVEVAEQAEDTENVLKEIEQPKQESVEALQDLTAEQSESAKE